jgi:hypothetical protein
VNSVKVRGFASLQFGYNAFAAVTWEPSFAISEASISAALSAAIGIDYETSATSGSITLAGVNLAGTLSYKSQPQSEIHGSLDGGITVIGQNINFSLPVHYSLSEQKILD